VGFASDLCGEILALLEVEIDFIFFGFGPKTEPGGHSVPLNIARQSLALVELKCPGQSIEVNLLRAEHCLLLESVLQVHEVNCFNPQVLLTLAQ
jgi:hypothetical protein